MAEAELPGWCRPGTCRSGGAPVGVDKRGLVDFARGLASSAWRSSPPAARHGSSREAGVETRPVEDYTGFPEILDGRVKTLNPRIYAGSWRCARRGSRAHAQRSRHPPDRPRVREPLSVRARVRERGVEDAEVIENIDIGGPTLIRAAAKNTRSRLRWSSPESYDAVLASSRTATGGCRCGRASAGARGVRVHRALRRGDRALVRRARGGLPGACARVREGARPRVRREPAPARGLLREAGARTT